MPRSLAGQMLLLLGIALFVAQVVNFALILNERQKLGLAQNQGPAIARVVNVASDLNETAPEARTAVLEDYSRRGAVFTLAPAAAVAPAAERETRVEAQLRRALGGAGVTPGEVRASSATGRWDNGRDERTPRRGGRAPRGDVPILSVSVEMAQGLWLNGRVITPTPEPFLTLRLVAATALLYLIVLGVTALIAVRIARPLRDLARAAEGFGGRGTPVKVTPRGSADLRRALEAFNAMNERVVALIDEKDRMLGAIGHDLRTPLASLRIRAEAMEPDSERLRMVATIEEMTATLEDILVLARSGRAREAARAMDVAALADTVVEDYREVGAAVEMGECERAVAEVQANLLRRALRNLIDNALKYGESAEVSVVREGGALLVSVRDRGPGLEPEQLERVLEPFTRAEVSRNRETGGAGLGLAIARAIAESHGGGLTLANAEGGGLVATLRVPAT